MIGHTDPVCAAWGYPEVPGVVQGECSSLGYARKPMFTAEVIVVGEEVLGRIEVEE